MTLPLDHVCFCQEQTPVRSSSQRRRTLIFDATPSVVDDPRGGERRLFSAVAYVQPGT